MKILTKKEVENLRNEITHIIDSGVNDIRLIEMIDSFIDKRNSHVQEVSETVMDVLKSYCDDGVIEEMKLNSVRNDLINAALELQPNQNSYQPKQIDWDEIWRQFRISVNRFTVHQNYLKFRDQIEEIFKSEIKIT